MDVGLALVKGGTLFPAVEGDGEGGWEIGSSCQVASGFSMKQELRALIEKLRGLRLAEGNLKFGRAAV